MGQLRNMLRGPAWNHGPECLPSAVLTMLDIASFARAVQARLQRLPDGTWRLTWANAGHPPPLPVPRPG